MVVVKCDCGIPARVSRSWTRLNPGRCFYSCKFSSAKSNGCGYWEWADSNQEEWQRVIINDLMLEKRLVEHEVALLKAQLVVDDVNGMNRGGRKNNELQGSKNLGFFHGMFVGFVLILVLSLVIVAVI